LAISPDGKFLASGHTDKTIKIWNLKTAKLLKTLSGHSDWVLSLAFGPDSNGKTLISGGRDQKIKVWHLGVLE
jgi:WD40 repeat protein